MIMLSPEAAKFSDDLDKITARVGNGLPDQQLDNIEQVTLLMINKVFPKDPLYRAFLTEATEVFGRCVQSKELLYTFLTSFAKLCSIVRSAPQAMTKEQAKERLKKYDL